MNIFRIKLPYPKISKRKARWNKTYHFERTDRVPVLTPFHSRYFIHMLDISAEKYLYDPEMMLSTQLWWKAWTLNNIHSDYFDLEARVDQGHYGESWALGCELGFDKYNLWIKSHPVKSEKDLAALRQRDMLDNPAFEHETRLRERMMQLADQYVLRFEDGVEIHPAAKIKPINETLALFTLVTDLRGPDIYLDIYDRPGFVHELMEIVLEKIIQRLEWVRQNFDYPSENVYICDDSSASLSPDAYREFVLPYNQRFKAHFGGTCTVHCCGSANHLVPIWSNELGVDVMWNFSYETDRQKVAQYMSGKTVLVGNVNWKSICQGTPEEVYTDALDVLETFAPHGGHVLSSPNIAPGVSIENLNAMYRAVETYFKEH